MFKRFIVKHNKSLLVNFDDNLTIEELHKYIIKILKVNNIDFFLTYNGKLLNKNRKLSFYEIENHDSLELIFRKRGGFLGMILAFIAVVAVLAILIKPIIDLLTIVGHMLGLLFHFLAIFPPLFETVLLIFDPKRFIDDLIFGVTFGIKSLFSGVFSSMDSGSSSNKAKEESSSIPKVCVPPTILNLIFLVLCPPLALLIDRGIQGFFHVLVCGLLTVKLYYFPGFIYAALHILC
jgi:hypothetical protein